MTSPRKKHVGKSRQDKERYFDMLRQKNPIDPTYEETADLPTDTVTEDDLKIAGEPKIPTGQYKPRDKNARNWILGIVGGIIITVISAIFILHVINLNREVGVLGERSDVATGERGKIRDDIKTLDNKINDVRVDIEVLKGSNSSKR